MTLDQIRSKEAEKRREQKAQKFNEMKLKASNIVQNQQNRGAAETSSPFIAQNNQNGNLPTKGQKKKKMVNESGKEYFQIQPLSRMHQLKSFYQISNSMNKLSVNISTMGVEKAMMKLGEKVEYEAVVSKN